MNLGYAGEMYANFGFWGGILGCGFFCLTFGLIFKEISVRAFISPLWWVVLPYIGTGAINAEDDIVGTINWTFKACLCMFAVCYIFPIFRRSLFSSNRIGSTFVSNQEKFRSGFASDTE